MVWEEVKTAKEEKRYELVLHGKEISERIAISGLDESIFALTNLNFLQISQTELAEVPEALGELGNLRTLDLHQNKLSKLPPSIGKLTELKFFDISGNILGEVPAELGILANLHTLNLSCNKLNCLPSFEKLHHLCKFDCSHNELTSLPIGIHQLQNLYELCASNNVIETISPEISQNLALKVLKLSHNKLKALPADLADCHKLKELTVLENPIGDNRLKKLIAQCSTKSVLDYVRNTSDKSKGKGKKGKRHSSKSDGDKVAEDPQFVIKVERSEEYKIVIKQSVTDVRPYVVCVIAKQIDLGQPEMLKKFINMQTKLHETACDHRVVATIATHSMASVSFPLVYEALPLDEISLVPLGKSKLFTATELVNDLKAAAIKEKQRTKRQAKSGLLKYLSLVENAETLACLKTSNGDVISLPPVTNSESSKISSNCMDILIEVTSSCDLNICKTVMDELIKRMFETGLCSRTGQSEPDTVRKELLLVQVRATDEEGNVKVVYPSKTDLSLQGIPVQLTEKN